ncbi:MAG TPA: 2Fe-2S iron-sulfur cluster-binding protein, partial [Rhizobiaceae bacterium]|nr:2Fe-2S iron-sulfur cluster-binding protein [Rhizobiaceae bacterium]
MNGFVEINGSVRDTTGLEARRLSKVLRDNLGLTGTKVGCNAGDCGACTVLIDGAAVCACLVAAGQVAGAAVETIEGLAGDPVFEALKSAFLRHGAAQCGICTPGMLVTATALLRANPHPDRRTVEDELGGVLCRCTGYAKIVDAVMAARRESEPCRSSSRGLSPGPKIDHSLDPGDKPRDDEIIGIVKNVGRAIPRLDGVPKVTGSEKFGADIMPRNALRVLVIRSPHHHARFRFGDIAGWRAANPGIEAVLTADDIPGVNAFGVIPAFQDQPVFAVGVARFRGEAVAAVVGESETIGALDPAGFPVEWEPLPALLTPAQALEQGAPAVRGDKPDNVLVRGFVRRGDAAAGLAEAAHVVERRLT